MDDMSSVQNSIGDLSKIITETDEEVWGIMDIIIFGGLLPIIGAFAILGAIVDLFRDDADIRKDKVDDFIKKKSEICNKMKTTIKQELKSNTSFKTKVSKALSNYFTEQMEQNLQQVTIPIE